MQPPGEKAPLDGRERGGLLRPHVPAMLLGGGASLVVVLGTYALVRWQGGAAALAALMGGTLCVALAAPALATGGRGAWATLLRGGIVADGAGVGLLVLVLVDPTVALVGALQVYLVWVAMALAAVAAVGVARGPVARLAMAMAVAVAMSLLLGSPLWIDGVISVVPGADPQRYVAEALYWNPLYSIFSAVFHEARFVWHYAPTMYGWSRVGQDVAEPVVPWHAAVWRYAVVAGGFAAAMLARWANSVGASGVQGEGGATGRAGRPGPGRRRGRLARGG